MKLINSLLTGLMAGWLMTAPPAHAEETQKPEPEEKLDLDLGAKVEGFNKFVFRGMTLSENPVVQPSTSATYKGLTLIGWANYDTEGEKVNEIDLVLDYTRSLGSFNTSAGYVSYFNLGAEDSQEVYVFATLDKFLQPTLRAVYDFGLGDGFYGEAAVGHSHSFGRVGLSGNALLALNHRYFREDSGLSHGEAKLSAPITLLEGLNLVPIVADSKSLDDDFQDEFFAGAGLEGKFGL